MPESYRFFRWLPLVLLCLPLTGRASFIDREAGKYQTLQREISYRADTAGAMSFEDVLASTEGWTSQRDRLLSRTRDPIRLWAKFDLPDVSAARHIFLNTSAWERAEFFVVRDGRLVDRQLTGTNVPTTERTTKVTMTPRFSHSGFVAVDLLPGSHVTVFVRLSSSQKYWPIHWLRVYLWDAEQVLAGERSDRLFQGLYLGVMFVLIVYNFGLFVTLRERSYLYYVLMELSNAAVWLIFYGITSDFFWPGAPWLDSLLNWPLFGLALATAIQFMRCYLDTARAVPRSDFALRWLAITGIVTALVTPVVLRSNFLLGVTILLAPAFITFWAALIVGFLVWRQGNPAGRHFLIAVAFSVVGGTVQLAVEYEMLGATEWTTRSAQIGNVVMGIVLALGLGFRLRHARAELTEQKLAEAERQNAHEREKRALIEEQNRTLETKVRERTAELATANEKVEGLLANILPQAIIEELKAKGITEPRRHEEVSILFTDFSGFTEAVATIPAKRLVQELDEIFRAFDEIAAVNGLEKIKTIGDAYMAAAGLPMPAADHAARCVRTGLALTRYIEKRNETSAIKWSLRVGVHSGAVVAGVVGKNKYAYDVWGDTVNLASRLESASERNRVNISAYTYDLVRDQFDCEYRSKLAAKGKGEIDMYLVRGEKTAGA